MLKSASLLSTALLIVLSGAVPSCPAADDQAVTSSTVDFERDIAPILTRSCLKCHGEKEPEGGLRLTGHGQLLHRNDSGEPAVIVGDSSRSELIRRVTAGVDERMPPEGDPLSEAEIDSLRRWIDAGAVWSEGDTANTHWAYVPPQRPQPPAVGSRDWVRNEIDAFVLAKLEGLEPPLSPSSPADPATLIRRVYLDLIGIPPSVEEVDDFLSAPSPTRYSQIVERLLQSPRFGEKWARQWLDLARYADSNGYQADQFRSMWAWRDWVIEALNDDMPFDQFTIEQLAGDLLPDATLDQRIATGFHRCTTCNVEAGVDPEENRVNQIVDRVNTTGTVWLGTTLECAQCHNHKYDPFTQQDYYQLFAFFNNTPLEVELPGGKGVQYEVAGPKMDLPLTDGQAKLREKLKAWRDDVATQIADRRQVLADERPAWEAALRSRLGNAPTWHIQSISHFESSGGATSEVQPDQSLLVTGASPAKDTYTITIDGPLSGVTGLKFECLTDASLPGSGPGRAGPRPNIILNELQVTLTASPEAVPRAVSLHTPRADFSQKNWDVAGILDDDPETGWGINPHFGKAHWVTVLTSEPLDVAAGEQLTCRLVQNYGGSRTIGRLRVSTMTGEPEVAVIPDDVRQVLAASDAPKSKEQLRALTKFQEDSDTLLRELHERLSKLDQQLAEISPETTLVMVEMDSTRPTAIFKRGNFLDPGVSVEPKVPAIFVQDSASNDVAGPQSRLALARWLVSAGNPLVARVTVNRWWAEIFGQGIVRTVEDFGAQGEPPSHPELLDWLAVEFVEHGWSMKHILRLIVTSSTYQQSSRVTPDLLERDSANTWLARGPRFRLSAEAIRDNALAISGLLSTKAGGPPVYPPQPPRIWRHVGRNAPKYETATDEDRFRRGIYVVWRRSAPYPSFTAFDAPDRGACCVSRSRTNTPLQALTLLNDPAYVEMAESLARHLESDLSGANDREKIEHGFRRSVSRQPTSDEVTALLTLFEDQRTRYAADLRSAHSLTGKATEPGDANVRLAAWICVANVLLNLDETITKE